MVDGAAARGVALARRTACEALVVAVVIAQVISTCSIGAVGRRRFRRFPRRRGNTGRGPPREIAHFVASVEPWDRRLSSSRNGLAPLLLGIVTTPTQLGFFRIAQAPQSGIQALSAPARMVLLTEQTRDWERGRQSAVLEACAGTA